MLESTEAASQSSSDQSSSHDLARNSTPPPVPGPSEGMFPYAKLAQRMQEMVEVTSSRTTTDRSIRQKLTVLANVKMASLETNVLQYWRNNNNNDMKKLAQIALAVPATQVSVERAFSALSLILTKLRSKLSNKTINNILITKLNYTVLDNIELDILGEEM